MEVWKGAKEWGIRGVEGKLVSNSHFSIVALCIQNLVMADCTETEISSLPFVFSLGK